MFCELININYYNCDITIFYKMCTRAETQLTLCVINLLGTFTLVNLRLSIVFCSRHFFRNSSLKYFPPLLIGLQSTLSIICHMESPIQISVCCVTALSQKKAMKKQ